MLDHRLSTTWTTPTNSKTSTSRFKLWNSYFLLVCAILCFSNQLSSNQLLYTLERHDGCGARGQQLFYLTLYANALDYDIGGTINLFDRRSIVHGANCTALLAKIGNFCGLTTSADKSIVESCQHFEQADLDQLLRQSDGRIKDLNSSCIYLNATAILIRRNHIENYYTKKITERMVSCFEHAQKNPETTLFQHELFDDITSISNSTEQSKSNTSDNRRLQVVMQIRRGDALSMNSRLTPLSWYLNMTQTLRSLKRYAHARYHIVSEGPHSDFFEFQQLDITLHLNETVEDSWGRMILADVLVMAKSSFSYVPAVLTYAELVLHQKFWHLPLPQWINADDFMKTPAAYSSNIAEGNSASRVHLYDILKSKTRNQSISGLSNNSFW